MLLCGSARRRRPAPSDDPARGPRPGALGRRGTADRKQHRRGAAKFGTRHRNARGGDRRHYRMGDAASVCGDVTRARPTMTDHANGSASDALMIARLAALTRGDYDRVRRKEADQLGWRVETLDAEVAKARRVATSCSEEVTDRPPEFTDEALALRFTELHKQSLRYVATWGRWLIWDGKVWQFDETLQAFDLSRAVCRKASSECNEERVAAAIASAKTVAAVERLAKADSASRGDRGSMGCRSVAVEHARRRGGSAHRRDTRSPPGRLHDEDHRGGASRRVSALAKLPGSHHQR